MRRWLRISLAVIAVLILVLVVPPLIGISRYKAQIAGLLSQSLGRPVHLSSVQVRVLPWPGFEISDLSVAENPAYGAEPVLHANKVTASLRLLALLGGRVEIGKIGVDEASLNLVRTGPGQWNLDSLFRTAAAQAGKGTPGRPPAPMPYLEATSSRINFKNGVEKLPFSLVNADVSFWQENSGEWRLRLKGQPARTDVSLYLEETGVVRMEASIRRAATLHQMPLHVDLDWRKAQLGQLARLVAGADPGWRGDLTGELHLDGTADSAHVTTRLRAQGVHRAEFTPTSPMDFDATCTLVYHYGQRSLENLDCNSPVGNGRVHLTGDQWGASAQPRFSLELDHVPVAAGLDAIRTLRSGSTPDLEAKGTVSGKIAYAAVEEAKPEPAKPAPAKPEPAKPAPAKPRSGSVPRAGPEPASPLTGSLTVEDFALSGGGLSQPVQAPRFTLEPVPAAPGASPKQAVAGPAGGGSSTEALAGSVAIPAGGTVPLMLSLRFAASGYEVGVRGQASFARARELAHAVGIPETDALASLAGEPISADLIAHGPWLPPEEIPLLGGSGQQAPGAPASPGAAPAAAAGDTLTGTVTLRNANWRADYLAGHVVIDEATLHLDNTGLRWDPVDFAYGPIKGTASVTVPADCPAQTPAQACAPRFDAHFGALDASVLESVLLGAPQKGTLLSKFIDRLRPSSAPPWPQVEGTVSADSLVLGPVKLEGVTASLRVFPARAEIASFEGGLYGGKVHLDAMLGKPANDRDKLSYTIGGEFENLNAAEVGRLLRLCWTGSSLSGNGKLELSGYTGDDLAASAEGTLHFECRQGSIAAAKTAGAAGKPAQIPAPLARFDRWTADAAIANGTIQLGQNEAVAGARKQAVEGTITLADPPRVTFPTPKETRPEKRP
ncbi:MAG: AsmA family protein [Terracidiphilus sp.]